MALPGIPHRPARQQPPACFADRRRYLHLLGETLLDTGCALHAYV
jgi:hypothetical protein